CFQPKVWHSSLAARLLSSSPMRHGPLVGSDVDTICSLERECLAQDQVCQARVAAAEAHAGEARLELESLARERQELQAALMRQERATEAEVSRRTRQAESCAQAEELKLLNAQRALSAAEARRDQVRRQAAAELGHAEGLLEQATRRVEEAQQRAAGCVEQVRRDACGRQSHAEDFAHGARQRIGAVAALPTLASLK
ncbi:unnamed protein product, partial [Effrenium voratum]